MMFLMCTNLLFSFMKLLKYEGFNLVWLRIDTMRNDSYLDFFSVFRVNFEKWGMSEHVRVLVRLILYNLKHIFQFRLYKLNGGKTRNLEGLREGRRVEKEIVL